jgi:hypothetical protein
LCPVRSCRPSPSPVDQWWLTFWSRTAAPHHGLLLSYLSGGQLCAVFLVGEVLHPTHSQCHFASKCLQKTGKCLVTVIGLSPGGSSTVHIYTQTINGTTQVTTEQHKLTNNVDDCGPCPIFASFILAFALQLRKSTEKPHSGYENPQSECSIHITKTPTHYKTYAHTLQNPQYGRIAEVAEIGI